MPHRSLVLMGSCVVAPLLARCQRTPDAGAGSTQAPRAHDSAWSVRCAHDALSLLSAVSRQAVSRSLLPVVLWFGDAALARASQVTVGPAWDAISARVGERTYSLHVVRDESNGTTPEGHTECVRGALAMVLFNEDVRSVTWSERAERRARSRSSAIDPPRLRRAHKASTSRRRQNRW